MSLGTKQKISLLGLIAGAGILALHLEAAEPGNRYVVQNLVSDQMNQAAHIDPFLVNAWGLAASSTSPWWVADNETAKSTLYDAVGNQSSLVVSVPGAPTGIVFPSSARASDILTRWPSRRTAPSTRSSPARAASSAGSLRTAAHRSCPLRSG